MIKFKPVGSIKRVENTLVKPTTYEVTLTISPYSEDAKKIAHQDLDKWFEYQEKLLYN